MYIQLIIRLPYISLSAKNNTPVTNVRGVQDIMSGQKAAYKNSPFVQLCIIPFFAVHQYSSHLIFLHPYALLFACCI